MYKSLLSFILGLMIGLSLAYFHNLLSLEILLSTFLGAIISILVSWCFNRKASTELEIQIKRLENLITKVTNQIKAKQEYGDAAHHTIINGKETTTLEMSASMVGHSKLSGNPQALEKGQS